MFQKVLTGIIIVLLYCSKLSHAEQVRNCPENCSCDNHMLKCGHELINNFDIDKLKSFTVEEAALFTSVDLSTNQLKSLNFDDFSAFVNMRTLKVEDNNISNLFGVANLTSLKTLLLAYNSIGSSKDISSGVFSGMLNLSELDLSSNSILNLPTNVFPKTLKSLKIGNNPLKKMSLENFIGGKNSSITSLDVEESPALSVDLNSFFVKDSPLENFTGSKIESVGSKLASCVLDNKGYCHYSKTKNIRVSNSNLGVKWGTLLSVFPNALKFDLSTNKIDHYILTHWMPFLKILILSENNIEILPSQMHENFLNLRYLDLAKNKITSINKILFLSKIETLLLPSNNISYIVPKALSSNNHLKVLDLSGNDLKFLNISAVPLDHKYKLRITGNPLECHCSWTINYEVLGDSVLNPEGTICRYLGRCLLCPSSESKKILYEVKNDETLGDKLDPKSNCFVSNHTVEVFPTSKSKNESTQRSENYFTTKYDNKKESSTKKPATVNETVIMSKDRKNPESGSSAATTVSLVLIAVVLIIGMIVGGAVLYRRGYFERLTTSIQQYSLQPR